MEEINIKKRTKVWARIIWGIFSIIIISLLIVSPTPILFSYYSDSIFEEDDTFPEDFDDVPGIVFGASITIKQEPSSILKDRLDIAASLFMQHKISYIILSGNDDTPYNEVSVMESYLLRNYSNITPNDIVLDGYGYRTFDTCIRAKELMDIDKAILITNGYHLPRSLFLCNNLGIESIGVNATMHDYEDETKFHIREVFAIDKSLIDIYLFAPEYSIKKYEE